MKKEKNWRLIFEQFLNSKKIKGKSYKHLLLAAGHLKSKTGNFTVKKWLSECRIIAKKLDLRKGEKILEIGSGSGALLKYFKNKFKIYGADYSKQLLNFSKLALPKGKFQYAEASKINYPSNFFDAIILYSCIQYFENTNYFIKVLKKIRKNLKKNGKLFIGEIVDKDKLIEFERHRISELGYEEYNLLYKKNKKLKHYALARHEILHILKNDFKDIEIYNSVRRGNEKEFYRFNLVCSKK